MVDPTFWPAFRSSLIFAEHFQLPLGTLGLAPYLPCLPFASACVSLVGRLVPDPGSPSALESQETDMGRRSLGPPEQDRALAPPANRKGSRELDVRDRVAGRA
jgi:hypothetical protein